MWMILERVYQKKLKKKKQLKRDEEIWEQSVKMEEVEQ
jgi:hypothetical protein